MFCIAKLIETNHNFLFVSRSCKHFYCYRFRAGLWKENYLAPILHIAINFKLETERIENLSIANNMWLFSISFFRWLQGLMPSQLRKFVDFYFLFAVLFWPSFNSVLQIHCTSPALAEKKLSRSNQLHPLFTSFMVSAVKYRQGFTSSIHPSC